MLLATFTLSGIWDPHAQELFSWNKAGKSGFSLQTTKSCAIHKEPLLQEKPV